MRSSGGSASGADRDVEVLRIGRLANRLAELERQAQVPRADSAPVWRARPLVFERSYGGQTHQRLNGPCEGLRRQEPRVVSEGAPDPRRRHV
jgi:hypothetical protein